MITKPRGTQDFLPEQTKIWAKVESHIRRICSLYNFKEVRTPMFESSELFHRNQQDSSDMVTKETYDFMDRGNRGMTLRPEGTAPAVRAFIENKMYAQRDVNKLFYIGPSFRYERPSLGRYRQFHQFGIEALGSNSPLLDTECIALAAAVIKGFGLTGVKVRLNTLGDEESRNAYKEALVSHFSKYEECMCEDCKNRLKKNPLRILDCKVDRDQEFFKSAPRIGAYLTENSKNHFNQVVESLKNLGIAYEIDETLVRGLDYYTYTVFEVEADIKDFGAANVICAGGRYNNLVKELGGPDTPAVGLAFGMERLIMALEAEGKLPYVDETTHIYFISLGDEAFKESSRLMNVCRMGGLKCEMDYNRGSLKSQFKKADNNQALFTCILGDNELNEFKINIKNNETDEQDTISINEVYPYVLNYIRSKTDKCHTCNKGNNKDEKSSN